jgi:hypothetical protein
MILTLCPLKPLIKTQKFKIMHNVPNKSKALTKVQLNTLTKVKMHPLVVDGAKIGAIHR